MRKRWLSVRAALDHPRVWRVTAALAALLLCVLLVGAAQGSVELVSRSAVRAGGASWERWCASGQARADRVRLAYCARVSGIVLWSTRGPGAGEAHVVIVGGFHLTVVKLPSYATIPGAGSRLVAIGPLVRARNGQREVQAFRLEQS